MYINRFWLCVKNFKFITSQSANDKKCEQNAKLLPLRSRTDLLKWLRRKNTRRALEAVVVVVVAIVVIVQVATANTFIWARFGFGCGSQHCDNVWSQLKSYNARQSRETPSKLSSFRNEIVSILFGRAFHLCVRFRNFTIESVLFAHLQKAELLNKIQRARCEQNRACTKCL